MGLMCVHVCTRMECLNSDILGFSESLLEKTQTSKIFIHTVNPCDYIRETELCKI